MNQIRGHKIVFTILKRMLILSKLQFGFFEKDTESHNSVLGCVKAVSQDNLNWIGLQYKQELTPILQPSPSFPCELEADGTASALGWHS